MQRILLVVYVSSHIKGSFPLANEKGISSSTYVHPS